MEYPTITQEKVNAVINKLGGERGVDRFLNDEVEMVMKINTFITHAFKCLVDETQEVEDAVRAGNFDYVSSDITNENFPRKNYGWKMKKEIILFRFNTRMSFGEIVNAMDKTGYKPATVFDLISLAVEKPSIQKKFTIVALGSIREVKRYRQKNRFVTCLRRTPPDKNDRRLELEYFGLGPADDYRIAGMHK